MPLAFSRMRDEIGLGLIVAAFLLYVVVMMPNYQKYAYENTKAKMYDKYERFIGYPADENYPVVNSVQEIMEQKEYTFTIEVDVEQLTALDLYMSLDDFNYSTNGFMRTIGNKGTERKGRVFLIRLNNGEKITVLLDDLTIDLPKEGIVRLPIGEYYPLADCEFKDTLQEVSGIEGIDFFIDMASEWKNSEEAKSVENVKSVVGTVLFFAMWIVISRVLIRLGEKK